MLVNFSSGTECLFPIKISERQFFQLSDNQVKELDKSITEDSILFYQNFVIKAKHN